MRNKENFIKDYNEVVKKEFQNDEIAVEDAAHVLNNSEDVVVTVESKFTTTGENESFVFEQKERPKTDNENDSIVDWFYVGRGEK